MTEPRVRVLFVCMGNICRSPTAEGVFRKLLRDAGLADLVHVDSAGTHAYHLGEPPDRRAQAAAQRRGIPIGDIRARRVSESDFEAFDLILAMDRDNLAALSAQAGEGSRAELRLLLEYAASARDLDVPDPYYGGAAGFERVLDLVEEAAAGLLRELERTRLGA